MRVLTLTEKRIGEPAPNFLNKLPVPAVIGAIKPRRVSGRGAVA